MESQILYLFDPLCGWCYGFSDTIHRFSQKYQKKYEFVPIPGGMVVDQRVQPISEIKEYIAGSIPRVEEMTGCEFGEAYKNGLLQSGTTMMNSEPPSRALITFRTFRLDESMAYARALQKSHYFYGKDYNETDWYGDLAEEFGIAKKPFLQRFSEKKMKQHVQEEFAWVRESGVQGYPTVVVRKGSKYYMLSNGYVPLEQLETTLAKAEQKIK